MTAGYAALSRNDGAAAVAHFFRARQLAPYQLRVQLALVDGFLAMGEVTRAEAFLNALLHAHPSAEVEQIYLSALHTIRKRHRLRFAGQFSLLPSTNTTHASSETTFDTPLGTFVITNGGDEKSGIGVLFGGRAELSIPVTAGHSLQFASKLNRIWYRDPDLRRWDGRLALEYRHQSAWSNWTTGLFVGRVYYDATTSDTSSDLTKRGIYSSWGHDLGSRDSLSLGAKIEDQRYDDKYGLSGLSTTLDVKWTHVTAQRNVLRLQATTERASRNLDYHSYRGLGFAVGFERNLTTTLRGGLSLGFTERRYDTEFAAVSYKRHDDIYVVGASISDRRIKWFGMTPKLSCSYKVQQSNVALYTYRTGDCQISATYNF